MKFDVQHSGFNISAVWFAPEITPAEFGPRLNYTETSRTSISNWNGVNYFHRYVTESYDVLMGKQDRLSRCCGTYQSESDPSADFIKYTGALKLDPGQRARLAGSTPVFDIRFGAEEFITSALPTAMFASGSDTTLSPMQPLAQMPYMRTAQLLLPDGKDTLDFTVIAANFGKELPKMFEFRIYGPIYDVSAELTHITSDRLLDWGPLPVPEPSSWLLMLSGLTVLGFAVRCSKRT
ncbi:PEP-CTERM sorting domain-containing protein [Massilia sp. erpn]|uniref:PEP-CTERM sorting domain-containing protein n=1 Tax=Massilia sp. erpn TaxID=2738142 RepID=UPI002106C922|nr:PEP-CTERM sorting domain-containing protein [Massilia sp. erpn]UTY57512.1 PEP-CTERM sorting domain-containing protein [Massilia sp. erpn]